MYIRDSQGAGQGRDSVCLLETAREVTRIGTGICILEIAREQARVGTGVCDWKVRSCACVTM